MAELMHETQCLIYIEKEYSVLEESTRKINPRTSSRLGIEEKSLPEKNQEEEIK